ncbi:hypothetical protein BD626DRAFT_568191 [Schizophyllum amplum]|uniref:Uncharacterized protein n=1 Tax=Schizophyllum amplum TaxID=97359 RepID=A0A550CI47_9AGAR|nr:hypothetical protein BD626DRAFT_568191 [Auriculariopsis ampla]
MHAPETSTAATREEGEIEEAEPETEGGQAGGLQALASAAEGQDRGSSAEKDTGGARKDQLMGDPFVQAADSSNDDGDPNVKAVYFLRQLLNPASDLASVAVSPSKEGGGGRVSTPFPTLLDKTTGKSSYSQPFRAEPFRIQPFRARSASGVRRILGRNALAAPMDALEAAFAILRPPPTSSGPLVVFDSGTKPSALRLDGLSEPDTSDPSSSSASGDEDAYADSLRPASVAQLAADSDARHRAWSSDTALVSPTGLAGDKINSPAPHSNDSPVSRLSSHDSPSPESQEAFPVDDNENNLDWFEKIPIGQTNNMQRDLERRPGEPVDYFSPKHLLPGRYVDPRSQSGPASPPSQGQEDTTREEDPAMISGVEYPSDQESAIRRHVSSRSSMPSLQSVTTTDSSDSDAGPASTPISSNEEDRPGTRAQAASTTDWLMVEGGGSDQDWGEVGATKSSHPASPGARSDRSDWPTFESPLDYLQKLADGDEAARQDTSRLRHVHCIMSAVHRGTVLFANSTLPENEKLSNIAALDKWGQECTVDLLGSRPSLQYAHPMAGRRALQGAMREFKAGLLRLDQIVEYDKENEDLLRRSPEMQQFSDRPAIDNLFLSVGTTQGSEDLLSAIAITHPAAVYADDQNRWALTPAAALHVHVPPAILDLPRLASGQTAPFTYLYPEHRGEHGALIMDMGGEIVAARRCFVAGLRLLLDWVAANNLQEGVGQEIRGIIGDRVEPLNPLLFFEELLYLTGISSFLYDEGYDAESDVIDKLTYAYPPVSLHRLCTIMRLGYLGGAEPTMAVIAQGERRARGTGRYHY